MPKKSLESLGIKLIQNTVVKDYDGIHVTLSDGSIIKSKKTYLGSRNQCRQNQWFARTCLWRPAKGFL
jgi:hypothetical protein